MFKDLQLFSIEHKSKMSRGSPEYMLQMSAVQLKSLLNARCKVIGNVYIFLRGNSLILSQRWLPSMQRWCEGCLGRWCPGVTPRGRNVGWGVQVTQVKCPFHFSFVTDKTLTKLFAGPCHGNISGMRRSIILLEPLFLSHQCPHAP